MLASFPKLALSAFALALPLALFAPSASAQEATPCGKFDLSNGIDCHIEVKGGCTANCTPIKFEAYCEGGCTADVSTICTGSCETTCVAQCDPNHLDCVAGCHTECEEPCVTQCNTDHPGEDCVTTCKGSCDMHCSAACGVTVDSCITHCRECCSGACSTQINLDCDIGCFAKLEGGCKAHCEAPSGALFCNGQYVFASDVQACITYLAQNGVKVDVSARAEGKVTCTLSGCTGDGKTSTSCSASPGQSSPLGASGIMVALSTLGLAAARRARRASRK
jgi:hypothetical protein